MPENWDTAIIGYATIVSTIIAAILAFDRFGLLVTVAILFVGALVFIVLLIFSKLAGRTDRWIPNRFWEICKRFADTARDLKLSYNLRRLKSKQTYTRRTSVEALGKIGTDKAVDGLKLALLDEESYVSGLAVETLGTIGTDYAAAAIAEAFKNSNSYVRKAAVEALGKIRTDKAVDGLKLTLKNSDSYIRRKAAEELDNLNWDPSDDSEKAYYLIARLELDELPKLGAPAVRPLIQALAYPSFSRKYKVAEVLGKMKDRAAVEPLITALNDQDELVRARAAWALGKIGDDRAIDPLIAALQDNVPAVRREAAGSLGKLGLPKAIGPLTKALKDHDPNVRREVSGSLDELGWAPRDEEERVYYLIGSIRWREVEELGVESVLPLIHFLRGFDEMTEERATSILVNIGKAVGEPAISLMIEAFRDEPTHVRSSLSLILGRIGPKALRLLLLAKNDDDKNVRDGARDALARFDPSELS